MSRAQPFQKKFKATPSRYVFSLFYVVVGAAVAISILLFILNLLAGVISALLIFFILFLPTGSTIIGIYWLHKKAVQHILTDKELIVKTDGYWDYNIKLANIESVEKLPTEVRLPLWLLQFGGVYLSKSKLLDAFLVINSGKNLVMLKLKKPIKHSIKQRTLVNLAFLGYPFLPSKFSRLVINVDESDDFIKTLKKLKYEGSG